MKIRLFYVVISINALSTNMNVLYVKTRRYSTSESQMRVNANKWFCCEAGLRPVWLQVVAESVLLQIHIVEPTLSRFDRIDDINVV